MPLLPRAPGLRAARPHLAFLLGLGAALAIMWKVRDATGTAPARRVDIVARLGLREAIPLRPRRALTAAEQTQAQIAWRYFENNYVATTGMMNATDRYPSTTLWDLGSYMMGVLAARDLGVVPPEVAHERLEGLLGALSRLPLLEGLPNKAYDTRTLAMVDYNNQDAPRGIGWSAIDIARLSVPLTITVWRDPDLAPRVRAILAAWRLDRAVAGGRLQGSVRRPDGTLELVQEGRLGYEQYAAEAMRLLGLDVEKAVRWDLEAAFTRVSGQTIVYDARLPARYQGTHNAVVSEPFLLVAFELGLGETTSAIAQAVYQAQRSHARELGRFVAVSEDNLDRSPYFVYNSVLNDGVPWAAFTPTGADASAHRSLSTKAAFGWGQLYDDAYAEQLLGRVSGLHAPDRGWYSGVYDADGQVNAAITANTNGIILEVLWHATRGPLLQSARQ